MTGAVQERRERRRRTALRSPIVFVVMLQLLIGCLYSGPVFFRHFTDGVPRAPVGRSIAFMPPGDQFEQLNRYTMVGANILRHRSPYYEGFEYNVSKTAPPFSEGWVFFPFSFFGGLLSILIGGTAAFNLLGVLSYPLAGVAMFALLRRYTNSFWPALLGSIVYSTLPFRTAFLYGEMVFGIDACMIPLTLLLFERFLAERDWRSAALFGGALFCTIAANFQSAYFFLLFGMPYFLVACTLSHRARAFSRTMRCLLAASVIPACLYAYHVNALVSRAVRVSSLQEVAIYTPSFANMLTVFNGNEKNVFIGFPALLLLAFLCLRGVVPMLREASADRRRLWCTFAPLFAVSYLFCFGTRVDQLLHAPVYGVFFRYFPGGSATRTPGRIMAVAGAFFAIVFGLAIDELLRGWSRRRRIIPVAAALLAIAVVFQNDYLSPSMAILEPSNSVYESIRGTSGRVLALPFQKAPDQYLNATYIYYGQKYDLHMFNGHSSLYPEIVRDVTQRLFEVSSRGEISEDCWRWLRENGYRFVIVHDTPFAPRIAPLALMRLLSSRFLQLKSRADNMYEFCILPSPRESGDESEAELIQRLSAQIGGPPILYDDGWYEEESYPGQKPFRWMHGIRSVLLVARGSTGLRFEVKCPYGGPRIESGNGQVRATTGALPDGWLSVSFRLPPAPAAYSALTINADRVYRAAPDPREFGCMIRDVEAERDEQLRP